LPALICRQGGDIMPEKTDAQILDLPDTADVDVAPVSGATEGVQPSEAPQSVSAPVAEPTQTSLEQPIDGSWTEDFVRAYPQFAKQFKALQEQDKFFDETFGSVRNARQFKQMLDSHGGLEGIKAAQAKAKELERVDSIVFGGDATAKRDYLQGIY